MNGSPVSDVRAKDAAEFWARLDESLADGSCLGTTLSKRRPGAADSPEKLIDPPDCHQGGARLSVGLAAGQPRDA